MGRAVKRAATVRRHLRRQLGPGSRSALRAGEFRAAATIALASAGAR
jgi:hypothetical protein